MAQTVKKMKPRKTADDLEHRLRTIAVVTAVCLMLVVGIVLVAVPGKGKPASITAQTSSAPAGSAPAAAPTTIEDLQTPPLSIYRRRNIFKPLVNMDTTAATTGTTSTQPTGAGPTVITMPPELDPSGREVGSVISTAIMLESVSEQEGRLFARIRIGDTVFEKVAPGQVFANNYKLLALGTDSSATILYGDERFTIYAGQSLYW